MPPAATVVVRARDKADTIGRALESLRAQTVRPEIIVVDSGSVDGTVAIAQRLADRVIEIAPADFSYGRALNSGAAAASAPVHFALSAHCAAPDPGWVERSLAHYRRPEVAGTNGRRLMLGGRPLHEPFDQSLAHARADPWWGFSNHASSWRAAVWAEFPFDETLGYAEDKEWALRVLGAGWTLVFDPELFVDLSHQWRQGLRQYYRRQRDGARAIGSFATLPPYGLRGLAEEWWDGPPDPRPAWRRRANPLRTAGLVGKFWGQRTARPRS
jgi:rhamnosyltransferase